MIDFNVTFNGMTPDNKYNIQFDIHFNKNNMFNEESLIRLLNGLSKNPKSAIDEVLLQNFEEVFDLITHFGIGIIIFPNLISCLGGQYQIQVLEGSPDMRRQQKDDLNMSKQQQ